MGRRRASGHHARDLSCRIINKNLVEDRRDWGRTRRDQETRYGTYIVSLRTACRRPESSTLETTWGPLPRKLESSTLEMTWGPLPRKLEFWTLKSSTSTLENIAGPFPSDIRVSPDLPTYIHSDIHSDSARAARRAARRGDRSWIWILLHNQDLKHHVKILPEASLAEERAIQSSRDRSFMVGKSA